MKFASVSILLVVFLASIGFAQAPDRKRSEMRAAKKEIKSYMQENVLPVLREQRARLDASLSSQDQAALDQIRKEMKVLREEAKALRPAKRKMSQKKEMPGQEQGDAMRKHAKSHRLLMNRAWAIADAHESIIYQLIDEIAPQKEQWASDIKAIMEKYRPAPEGDELENAPDAGPHHGKGRPGGRKFRGLHGKLGQLKQLGQPAMFLLWDGEALPGRFGMERGDKGEGKRGDRVKVIPNPASDEHEVSFRLKAAGPVTFTLLDYAGKPVQQTYSGNGVAGKNTVTLSVEGLKSGLYFYQIESSDGEKAVRFYVN